MSQIKETTELPAVVMDKVNEAVNHAREAEEAAEKTNTLRESARTFYNQLDQLIKDYAAANTDSVLPTRSRDIPINTEAALRLTKEPDYNPANADGAIGHIRGKVITINLITKVGGTERVAPLYNFHRTLGGYDDTATYSWANDMRKTSMSTRMYTPELRDIPTQMEYNGAKGTIDFIKTKLAALPKTPRRHA